MVGDLIRLELQGLPEEGVLGFQARHPAFVVLDQSKLRCRTFQKRLGSLQAYKLSSTKSETY